MLNQPTSQKGGVGEEKTQEVMDASNIKFVIASIMNPLDDNKKAMRKQYIKKYMDVLHTIEHKYDQNFLNTQRFFLSSQRSTVQMFEKMKEEVVKREENTGGGASNFNTELNALFGMAKEMNIPAFANTMNTMKKTTKKSKDELLKLLEENRNKVQETKNGVQNPTDEQKLDFRGLVR